MKQYIVDAFADKPFSGNPAAVCILETWPDEGWMLKLAAENNLSETAFLVRKGTSWELRWFTPLTEVGLCGHATLASAFVAMNCLPKRSDSVVFLTGSGKLAVRRTANLYKMDFPLVPQEEIAVTEMMARAFGARPVKALLGPDLVCVFEDENLVRNLKPKQELLAQLPGRGQNATAPGSEADCVSRSFFPKLGIAEDPVCGSAHCQIAPYWANILGKNSILAYQASKRGGFLYCAFPAADRIEISGKACLVAISELQPDAQPRA